MVVLGGANDHEWALSQPFREFFPTARYHRLRSWYSACPMHHHALSSCIEFWKLPWNLSFHKSLPTRIHLSNNPPTPAPIQITMAHLPSTVGSSDGDLSRELATLMAVAVFLGPYEQYPIYFTF